MNKAYIYGLRDPRDGAIRYVGKSVCPEVRLQQHLEDTKNADKVAWLAELRVLGLVPEMTILETTTAQEWKDAERWWIADGRDRGWPLVNKTKGGDGGEGRGGPDWSFFMPYVRPDLRAAFASMPFREKANLTARAAFAMIPILQDTIRRRQSGEQVDQEAASNAEVWAAIDVVTATLDGRI